jgi:hypothetical protein
VGLTVPSALTTKFVNHHRRNRPGNDGRAVRGQDRPEPVPADDPFGVSRDDLPEREREAREGPKGVWGAKYLGAGSQMETRFLLCVRP